MIDKADVLSLEKGRVPENLADNGRTFHTRGTKDIDVIGRPIAPSADLFPEPRTVGVLHTCADGRYFIYFYH
jgi:hypothetical protein